MKDIDRKIREALAEDDAELFDKLGAQEPLPEMMAGVFRGRPLWLTVIGQVFIFAFLGIAIWSVFRFFDATAVRDQIFWAAAFLYSGISVAFLKIWFWLEMQKNSVIREVKRVELQIAQLARRLTP